MKPAHRFVAFTCAVAVASSVALIAQDTPDALMGCITNGTKVRHTYIQHADPARLKRALQLFETKAAAADYPEGTIIRMIPQEAMVKRSKAAFPKTNGWEYFALAVTPQGTTVRARGDEASNRLGTCQSCHSGAAKSDYLCGAGPGCTAVPLTEEQIAQLQAADPRCAK
jgi:hypothetical protein